MSTLSAAVRRFLVVLALPAAALWYLSENPAVGRAFASVLAAGVAATFLARRRTARAAARRTRTLGDLLSLGPAEFERAVAAILACSYRRVRVVGRAADLGIDVTCVDSRGRLVVVQCKRHAPGIAVGSGDVQRFLGSMTHAGAQRGILVTTSRFSAPAAALAGQHGIELVDGAMLVRMLRRARRPRGSTGQKDR